MNYLAHLYFSSDTPDSMVGNLIPDFTKTLVHETYSSEVIEGIALHRFIDQYTDKHSIVKESKARISKERRRFSAILIDIFYDHFLAKHWELYTTSTLRESTHLYYKQLALSTIHLPKRLEEAIIRMPQIDLLYNYQDLKGMEHAVNRLSQRIRFENNLYGGIVELEENYLELEADFHHYFRALQIAVDIYKSPSSESLSQSS